MEAHIFYNEQVRRSELIRSALRITRFLGLRVRVNNNSSPCGEEGARLLSTLGRNGRAGGEGSEKRVGQRNTFSLLVKRFMWTAAPVRETATAGRRVGTPHRSLNAIISLGFIMENAHEY